MVSIIFNPEAIPQTNNSWLGLAILSFILFAITIVLLMIRIEEVKKLKKQNQALMTHYTKAKGVVNELGLKVVRCGD